VNDSTDLQFGSEHPQEERAMKYGLMLFIFVAFISVCCISAQAESPKVEIAPPTVRVASLLVQRNYSNIPWPLVLNNPGIRMQLIIAQPGRTFIDLDRSASMLEAMTDDQKTDLTKLPVGDDRLHADSEWLPGTTVYSKDRSAVGVYVYALGVPSPNAREIQLKGKIALKRGAELKTVERKVKIAAGTKIQFGKSEFTIVEVAPVADGLVVARDARLKVALENETGFETIKNLAFLDAEGQEIKLERIGHFSPGGFGKSNYGQQYGLAKAVDEATVKVSYFEKVETVEVPLDLKVGIGGE
jgi:hypothetical protein